MEAGMRGLKTSVLTSFSPAFIVGTLLALTIGLAVAVLSFYFGSTAVLGTPVVPLLGFWALKAGPVVVHRLRTIGESDRWYFLLWLLVFLSGLVFRIREAETIQENPLDFWAIYRISLTVLVGFVLLKRLAEPSTRWISSLFRGSIGWLAAYALLALASTLWSVYPLWTLYRSVEYLIDVALIAAIFSFIRTTEQWKALFDWTWVFMGGLIATVWLGMIAWPDRAINRGVGFLGIQIEGVIPTISSNGVGEVSTLLAIIALTRLLFPTREKGFYLGVLFLSIVTLIFSQSRGPFGGLIVALAVVLVATGKFKAVVIPVILIVPLLFLTVLGRFIWLFFLRGQTPEQLITLTGRVWLWKLCWKLFLERPWLGHGAYAANRFLLSKAPVYGGTIISGADNTFIEVLTGIGVIGLIPLLLCLTGTWYSLGKQSRHAAGLQRQLMVESIGVLSLLSMRALFTAGAFIWHPSLAFLLTVGYTEFLRRQNPGIANVQAKVTMPPIE
jgi:O-antigen ligase